jgi:tetratricopeptide (TPR) repeat protein
VPGDAPNEQATAGADDRLARAMRLQLAGNLAAAEELYRALLAAQPRDAAANHCLGMLQVQAGRPADGLAFLFAALETSPQTADYWLGYLEALLLAGQIDAAHTTLALACERGLAGEAAESFAKRLDEKKIQSLLERGDFPAALDLAKAARAGRPSAPCCGRRTMYPTRWPPCAPPPISCRRMRKFTPISASP